MEAPRDGGSGVFGAASKHLAEEVDEVGGEEGFLEEEDVGAADGGGMIYGSGDEEDGDAGIEAGDALSEFVAAHAGHGDVGDEHVDGLFLAEAEGFGGQLGTEDADVLRREHGADEADDLWIVIDDEHGLGARRHRCEIVHRETGKRAPWRGNVCDNSYGGRSCRVYWWC